jgi:hypothetical protein
MARTYRPLEEGTPTPTTETAAQKAVRLAREQIAAENGGVAPAPSATAAPATPAPATTPTTNAPAAATEKGRTAVAPNGEVVQIPDNAPAGIEDWIALYGPPSNLDKPGKYTADTIDPYTKRVIKAGTYRYVWTDGRYLGADASGAIISAGGGKDDKESVNKAPTVRTKPDGSTEQWDAANSQWVPKDAAPAPKASNLQVIHGKNGDYYLDPVTKKATRVDGTPYSEDPETAIQAQAKARLDNEYAAIKNGMQRGEYEIAEAKLRAEQARDAVSNWYKEQTLRMTGRGQDMDYGERMATNATSAANAMLPYMVPVGAMGDFNKAIASLGSGSSAPVQYGGIPTAPLPWNPITMPQEVATRAMGSLPQPAYTAPSALTGAVAAADQGALNAYSRQSAVVAAVPSAGQQQAAAQAAEEERKRREAAANPPSYVAPGGRQVAM